MVDQDPFGIVSVETNGNYVRSPGVSARSNESRDALAYSARAYHRKAHKPRLTQNNDGAINEGWTSRIEGLLPYSIRSRINLPKALQSVAKGECSSL